MADVLTHVLGAFALFTVFGWSISWLDRRWVAVGMVGAVLPDLNRLDLILNDHTIATTLGVPFHWGAIHTLGGVVLLGAIGAMVFPTASDRRRGFLLLLAGGASHLLLDGMKVWADGRNGAYLYPLSWWRNPTPGWYVSSDRWVLLTAVTVVVLVLLIDRYWLGARRRDARDDGLS